MSVLGDYLQRAPSKKQGYNNFIDDMTSRHAYDPIRVEDHKQWVRFRWHIEFRLKTSETEKAAMRAQLTAAKQGDLTSLENSIKNPYTFETYHLLATEKTHGLQSFRKIRAALLPLATLGVFVTAPLLFFWILFDVVVLVALLTYRGPVKNGWVLPVGTMVGGLLFVACLKAQLFLRSAGRPPDTDDFDDQRLKVQSVDIVL